MACTSMPVIIKIHTILIASSLETFQQKNSLKYKFVEDFILTSSYIYLIENQWIETRSDCFKFTFSDRNDICCQ